jgi:hypothetical protein
MRTEATPQVKDRQCGLKDSSETTEMMADIKTEVTVVVDDSHMVTGDTLVVTTLRITENLVPTLMSMLS